MPTLPLPRYTIPLSCLAATAFCFLSIAKGANPPPTPAEGRKVFERNCLSCHAVGGKGGALGPKLDDAGARHDAERLRRKVVDPKFNKPDTTMPAVPLKPRELDALVVYLVSLKPSTSGTEYPKSDPNEPEGSKTGTPPANGKPVGMAAEKNPPAPLPAHEADPKAVSRGAEIYREKACMGCHKLGGEGGTLGSALDDVGSRRDAEWLRVQITNPKAHNPNSIMPAYPLPPADLEALVAFLLAQKGGGTPPAPTSATPTGPATFVGSAACLPCHAGISREFQRTVHSDALLLAHKIGSESGCESCHGPGSRHAATGDPKLIVNPVDLSPRRNSELCMRCHTGQVSSHEWLTSAHSQAGVSCSSCHEVMRKVVTKLLRAPANELCAKCHRKEAAQFASVSHHPVPEGRMQCVDCHNPHSGVNEAMLRQPANDQCVSCHADQQGPFEFEHPAVNGGFTEGCMSCHNPHGSPFQDLRRIAGRGLCVQCHTDKAVGHFDSRPDCSVPGCHVEIHGSHDDPLFFR